MSPAPSLQELIQLVETETEDDSPLGRLRAASGLAGHLAEVGYATVGYFVDQARRAGQSWSQIGDALGVSKQAAQQKYTVRHAWNSDEPGFEGFTPRDCNAVSDAEFIARAMGHDYVGTEHLLLSLYRDPHGLAAQILVESGLGEDQATAAIEQRVERGSGARDGRFAAHTEGHGCAGRCPLRGPRAWPRPRRYRVSANRAGAHRRGRQGDFGARRTDPRAGRPETARTVRATKGAIS